MNIIKKTTLLNILGFIVTLIPIMTFAQSGGQSVNAIIKLIQFVIKSLFPILVSVAGIVFMYQVVRYIMVQDVKQRDQYRKGIISNLLILVVLLGFWSIIAVASNTFGLTIGTDATIAGKTSLGSWNNCKTGGNCTVRDIIGGAVNFLGTTIGPMIIAVAALAFMYNVVVYMSQSGNEAERTKARTYIFWSLLALMIMLTVISILNIGTKTFFGSSSFIPQFPTSIPTSE